MKIKFNKSILFLLFIKIFLTSNANAFQDDITKKYNNIFESFSKEVIYVGPFGNGMKFKILANLLVTIHNTAAAEALRLGECAGLDKDMIYKVLGNSAATSVMLQKRMPLMINQNYEPPTASFNIFLKLIS